MAHFAELDENNIVKQVIVVHNNELLVDGVESEQAGIDFCVTLFDGTWIQTSYNSNFRKNYAGIGFTYDPIKDAFIPPQPYPSWVLNEETCRWQAPIAMPIEEGKFFTWDEESISWKEVN
jgi:hypothetical protein